MLFAAGRQLLDQSDKTFLLALWKLREYNSHSHTRMRRLHISRASELDTLGLHPHIYLGSCRQRRKSLHIAAAEGDISQGSPKASRAALRTHFNTAITDIANVRSFFSKRHSYSTSLGVFTPTYFYANLMVAILLQKLCEKTSLKSASEPFRLTLIDRGGPARGPKLNLNAWSRGWSERSWNEENGPKMA